MIATGFPHKEKHRIKEFSQQFESLFSKCGGIRRMGSAALDLAYTACGRFDCFWEAGLSIWDIAAGAIIVSEAGGMIMDKSSKSWEPFVSFNRTNYHPKFNSELVSWRHNILAGNTAIAKLFANNLHDKIYT